jgi:hypothetical protein
LKLIASGEYGLDAAGISERCNLFQFSRLDVYLNQTQGFDQGFLIIEDDFVFYPCQYSSCSRCGVVTKSIVRCACRENTRMKPSGQQNWAGHKGALLTDWW